MALRDDKGGFKYPGYNPLEVPNEPTSVDVAAGDAEATVSFTAPVNTGGGAITGYQATTTAGDSITGSASPLTLTGLTNGTTYNVRVWALNSFGPGPYGAGSASPVASIGLIALGLNNGGTPIDVINRITINSSGNATDFGNLTIARGSAGSVSSATRGVFIGGESSGGNVDVMDYVTISSTGNATDFGNLDSAKSALFGAGSSTRGIFGNYDSTYDYITIASTGNAADFGNSVTYSNVFLATAASSPTRMVTMGNGGASQNEYMEYLTISTTGNATTFGNLNVGVGSSANGCMSSGTRGICAGGETDSAARSNFIQYITIATTSNATDFGDLTTSGSNNAGTSSTAKAIITLGATASISNVIEEITIATTGNSTDFGDLTQGAYKQVGLSNSHGGLS